MKVITPLLVSLTAWPISAAATSLPQVDFEDGTFTGWTTGNGTTTTLASDDLSLGGSDFSLTAKGSFMAKISPDGSSVTAGQAEGLLGLSSGTITNALSNSTNFGFITGSFGLAAGDYTFGWSYAAQDYQPYDDGVFFSLAGGSVSEFNILAANVTGQTETLIVGSYGSTPWQLTTFTISEAGTYQLGF